MQEAAILIVVEIFYFITLATKKDLISLWCCIAFPRWKTNDTFTFVGPEFMHHNERLEELLMISLPRSPLKAGAVGSLCLDVLLTALPGALLCTIDDHGRVGLSSQLELVGQINFFKSRC